MATIKAPVPFSGIRGNLTFVDGVSDTNDVWLIQWFKEHGYEVVERPDESDEAEVEDESGGGIAEMTVKELRAYAAGEGIDLGKAKTKAGILAAIKAVESAAHVVEGEGENE